MKKYSYHTETAEALEKHMKLCTFNFLAGIILGIILLIMFFAQPSLVSVFASWFLLAICILNIIIQPISDRRARARLQNLKNTCLEIHNTHVCGMFCKDIAQPNNSEYFEILISQIKRVEVAEQNVVVRKTDYTLAIHTINGSYKLCINSARDAAQTIEQLMQGQASIPTYQQQPPYQQPQAYQQPTYQQPQQPQTYQQPVVKPPYSCGKCGAPGPYNGSCPQCGSSIKIYHH